MQKGQQQKDGIPMPFSFLPLHWASLIIPNCSNSGNVEIRKWNKILHVDICCWNLCATLQPHLKDSCFGSDSHLRKRIFNLTALLLH